MLPKNCCLIFVIWLHFDLISHKLSSANLILITSIYFRLFQINFERLVFNNNEILCYTSLCNYCIVESSEFSLIDDSIKI
jgi:hypothetical protein